MSVVPAALCVCSTECPFSFADDTPRPRPSVGVPCLVGGGPGRVRLVC